MWLIALAATLAVIEWIAAARKNRKLEYFAKPATLLALTLWFLSQTGGISLPLRWAFAAGLAFSLLGDIFLMLPADRFREGLLAFLLAHVAYIAAFNSGGVVLSAGSMAIAAALLVLLVLLLRIILRGMARSGKTSLRLPVVIYALVLMGTTWSALTALLRPDWLPLDAALLAAGSLLFMGSDFVLAVNRFVRAQPSGRVPQLAAYHLGQFLMAIGVWHHLTATSLAG